MVTPDYFRTIGPPLVSGRVSLKETMQRPRNRDRQNLPHGTAGEARSGGQTRIVRQWKNVVTVVRDRGVMLSNTDWTTNQLTRVYGPVADRTDLPATCWYNISDPESMTRVNRDAVHRRILNRY